MTILRQTLLPVLVGRGPWRKRSAPLNLHARELQSIERRQERRRGGHECLRHEAQ